jgi:hypothetical protein
LSPAPPEYEVGMLINRPQGTTRGQLRI